MSAPINVWLDCDPGHDDAFAIILAGNNDKIKLLGISTVAGNQTVERTTINALRISSISGMESVPVAKGLAKPLMRKSRICPEIHGTSGLDGTNFPELTKKVVSEKAPLYIHDVVTKLPKDEKLTIVATACLTNIALFITLFPEDKERIENIYLLGGCGVVGKITPSAEFNILVDPEAARIVYESGIPIYMVPIDVSHTVLATPEIALVLKLLIQIMEICLLNCFVSLQTLTKMFLVSIIPHSTILLLLHGLLTPHFLKVNL